MASHAVVRGVGMQRGRTLAVVLAAVVALLSGLALRHAATPEADVASSASATMPAAARAAVSEAIGRDDQAYWIRDGRLSNPAQHLAARVDPAGVTVAHHGLRLTMRLDAIGRGRALRDVPAAASVTAHANRTTLAHPGVSEWYMNGPAGLEQGFDVAARPAGGAASLTLALATTGARTTRLAASGAAVFTGVRGASLTYAGLVATDATGRPLRARLALDADHRLLVHVADRGARYPLHIDPAFTQTAKLTASDPTQYGYFGASVAFDGKTLVVGASNAVGAYVFTAASGSWTQVARLTSTAGLGGGPVALAGDTIVVGSPNSGAGKAAVWTRPASGVWADATESQVLTGSDAVDQGRFGGSLAIEGNTLLISGGHDEGLDQYGARKGPSGAVFVFTRSGSTWVQTQDLSGPARAAGDGFGRSLAISGGQFVAAGAEEYDHGSAYLYAGTNGGSWSPTATMTPGEPSPSFGSSVAMEGTTVVVGANKQELASEPGMDPGTLYVFDTRSPGQRIARLTDLTLVSYNGGNLGSNVAISGSTIISGVANQPANGQIGPTNGTGYVDVWQMPAGGWTDSIPNDRLFAADGAPSALFGSAVAMAGKTLVIGSDGTTVNGLRYAGSVYLFGGHVNALTAKLEPNTVGENDVFDLKLTVTHNGDASTPPIPLTFSGGNGLTQDDSIAAGGAVPTLTPIIGPLPGFPSALNPGETTTHLMAYAIDSPGTTRLKATVSGTDADGTEHRANASVLVSAEIRQPSRQDLDGLVAGSLIKLFDAAQAKRDKLVKKISDRVHTDLAKHKDSKGWSTASAYDKAMAQRFGLPDNGLSFLTASGAALGKAGDSAGPTTVLGGLLTGLADGGVKVGKSTLKTTVVVPFEYYRDFLFHPDGGSRAGMAMEFARTVGDGLWTTGGYLGTAAKFYTSPAAMTDAWVQMPRIEAELESKLDRYTTEVGDKIIEWDELVKKNPAKAAKQFGSLLGEVEAQVALFWAQNVLGANVTKSLKSWSAVRTAAGVTEAEVGGATTTLAVAEEAASATPIAATSQLGNLPAKTIARMQQIVKDVSAKFGVKIELQARPINPLAAKIEGGIGKVEAVPTKNLTTDDVILGAPEKWNGQTAYYEPKRPTGFSDFDVPTQKRLDLRFEEKLKEYKQFIGELKDPTGKTAKVHKALKPGGDKIDLGKNGKLVMELEQTVDEETGAILLRYKKLQVNGTSIFKGKPRPIVSDVDFNAVVDALTGKALPAGIRGQVELELMHQFAKAAKDGDLLFGFHGWTHSGFDIASKDFRHILKYMLMYQTDADAAKIAAKYAPLYHVSPQEFLDGYTKGKLLVKITPDSVTMGAGAL